MDTKKIKSQLLNDKAFQAMYSAVKQEDRAQLDAMIDNICNLAENAAVGFSTKMRNSDISDSDVASAINDNSGRK